MNSAENNRPEPVDFRLYLQQELMRRCGGNPSYSLRAFARSLQLHPATLSHVLKGTRPITRKMFAKFCLGLSLSPAQAQRFSSGAYSKDGPRTRKQEPYRDLTVDTFHIISDWYHYAILELMRLKHFRGEPKWIAKTLGITVTEANAAIERLLRLEFIEIREDGSWVNVSGNNSNLQPNDFTSAALRKLQKQILEKAIVAIQEIPLGERDQSSMTLAFDSRRMPEAIEKIKAFRREFAQSIENGGEPDRVYHLSISLYPVNQKTQKESEQ